MNQISLSIFFVVIAFIVILLFALGKNSNNKRNSLIISDDKVIHIRFKWFSTILPILSMFLCVLTIWVLVFFESDERSVLYYEFITFISTAVIIFFYLRKKKSLDWK